MPNEFKVTFDGNTTSVVWDGRVKFLELIRDVVIPKVIEHQKKIDTHQLEINNFEYKPEEI